MTGVGNHDLSPHLFIMYNSIEGLGYVQNYVYLYIRHAHKEAFIQIHDTSYDQELAVTPCAGLYLVASKQSIYSRNAPKSAPNTCVYTILNDKSTQVSKGPPSSSRKPCRAKRLLFVSLSLRIALPCRTPSLCKLNQTQSLPSL